MTTARPLPLKTKLYYSSGAVALGLKDNGFSYFLLLFYNQVVGLPPATVGLAIMIALMIDALFDPVIGQISDNWRSRWGRRHPFMYASAVPVALSYLLLWNPPLSWSHEALFFYLIGSAIIIRTFLALFEIPSTALAPELAPDYHERTHLLALRAAFNWYAALIMSMVTLRVLLYPTEEYPVAQLNPGGYSLYGVISACVMFTAIMISALGTHHRIPHLRLPPPKKINASQALRQMFSAMANRALLPMLGAGIFNSMAYGLQVALSLYFNTYLWGFSSAQVSLFILAQFGSSALAISIATPLSRRLGKRNAAILCKILGPGLALTPLTLRMLGVFPENDSPLLLPIMLSFHLFAVGFASVVVILHGSMSADAVEDHELRSGNRSEGVMAAANIFVAKTTSGIGIFASSSLLVLVDFPAGAVPGEVDADVIRNLVLIYLPLIVAIHACAIACIMRYHITSKSHAETVAQLSLRATPNAHGEASPNADSHVHADRQSI